MVYRVRSVLIFLAMIVASLEARAADLINKSTEIGDALAPSNAFVVCVAQKALSAAFGDTRNILIYAPGNSIGEEFPPEFIFFEIITDQGETLRIVLQSTDLKDKWQWKKSSAGEVFFSSISVSPTASVTVDDNAVIGGFDISECQ